MANKIEKKRRGSLGDIKEFFKRKREAMEVVEVGKEVKNEKDVFKRSNKILRLPIKMKKRKGRRKMGRGEKMK